MWVVSDDIWAWQIQDRLSFNTTKNLTLQRRLDLTLTGYITACTHGFVSRRNCFNFLGIVTNSWDHICHLKELFWWPLYCCKWYYVLLSAQLYLPVYSTQHAHRDSDEEEESPRFSLLCDTEACMSNSNTEHPDADIWFPSISFPVLCGINQVRATLPWHCQMTKGNLPQAMLRSLLLAA